MNPTNDNKAITLKAEIEENIKRLASLTSEASKSDAMRNFLTMISSFHIYSPNNLLSIFFHNPNASLVAGFQGWKKRDRYVKRGEHGIPILAPLFHENPDDNSIKILTGFRTVYVFDISQTDGKPLPPPPDWKSPEMNVVLQNKLIRFASTKGIEVHITELNGDTQGRSCGGRIDLIREAGTKTLIHEIAHELMHRGSDRIEISREEKELEAEAVAFVVSNHFCMSGVSSPNYLALWEADEQKILARMGRITQTANEIISAIEPQNEISE